MVNLEQLLANAQSKRNDEILRKQEIEAEAALRSEALESAAEELSSAYGEVTFDLAKRLIEKGVPTAPIGKLLTHTTTEKSGLIFEKKTTKTEVVQEPYGNGWIISAFAARPEGREIDSEDGHELYLRTDGHLVYLVVDHRGWNNPVIGNKDYARMLIDNNVRGSTYSIEEAKSIAIDSIEAFFSPLIEKLI